MRVMVNGLPGKMATEVAMQVAKTDGLELFPYSLTGADITADSCSILDADVVLVRPGNREAFIGSVLKPQISVDFTHPSAVNGNADYYCRHELPFVMGTTGGDRAALEQRVKESRVVAVIAPNMAKQVVALQAMMKYAAETFPGSFKGYTLEIVESHQQAKADTSGTAKAMIGHFNALGIPFTVDEIGMVRDPFQQLQMGVPREALGGHGWHTYELKAADGSVLISFTHNVNGRAPYVAGTMDAIRFLGRKVDALEQGRVYSMMDVLKGK